MIQYEICGLLIIIFTMISAVITYTITKKRYYEKGYSDCTEKYKSDLYRSEDVDKIVNEKISAFKNSEEFKMILNYHFENGVKQGAENELTKFAIEYKPFVNTYDDFFKKKAEIGYSMQLFYNNLPLGDPMNRITQKEEKFKEENLNIIIENITQNIRNISAIAKSNMIPVNISSVPERNNNKKTS